MLVGERMTRNPVTAREELSIEDALHLMRERRVRRLPVIDASGKMVGIVSDRDLLHAAPSPVTSLSVHELNYLLAKLTVKRLMTSPVITVQPNTPLEEAARIMADNKIGGLPVVADGELVGIITETDIFKILLELMGARVPGLRITLAVQEGKGVLASLTRSIADLGANIVSLVTYTGPAKDERLITFKINGIDAAVLRQALDSQGIRVTDFRTG